MIRERLSRTLVLGCLAWCAAAACTGCGCPNYNLKLSLDPDYAGKLSGQRVFVHVVPTHASDRKQFDELSLDEYWQYRSTKQPATREKDTKMFELSAESPSVTLTCADPIWQAWKQNGVTELLILSSLPIPDKPGIGDADPRRRFIPVAREAWTAGDVRVSLTAGGLRVQTQRAPSR